MRDCAPDTEKSGSGSEWNITVFRPEILAEATERSLRELGIPRYRAKYIAETARTIVQEEISLEKTTGCVIIRIAKE